jgi:ABC-type branched-subunit amino acid transport system substrate-binding protein
VATYDPTRDDPILKAFTEQFTDRFHHEPGTFAAHAYDGANILIAAIHKAGPHRARIRDALAAYTHFDGVTGSIDFDTTLNDIGPVYIATVEHGRLVYREANFTKVAQQNIPAPPYRTLADSPPTARSPDRPSAGDPNAYRIGCFLPLDEAGQAAVRGIEMAFADDASEHPHDKPIELIVRDSRGTWGSGSTALVDLVFEDHALALIGSTERRATHLAEMLAAKMHFPVITLCATDATITQVPLPWVFRVASEQSAAAWGYDAGSLVASRIRAGANTRRTLRDGLADRAWNRGVSGTYRFDPLGNRIDPPVVSAAK